MKVNLLSENDKTSLVEYVEDGNIQRVYIPSNTITDGECMKETLDAGLCYGIPWEYALELNVTPELLANNLRNAGIWTADDVKPNVIFTVLQQTYGVDVASVINIANQSKKER